MSRIDNLIRQHCPQGVPYRALGDVGEVFRGRRFTKADYVEDGTGAIHYGELYTHYGTSATEVITRVRADLAPNLRFVKPGDVVIADNLSSHKSTRAQEVLKSQGCWLLFLPPYSPDLTGR